MLEIGQDAPDFELSDGSRSGVRLKDFRGRKVVIYFYPKDATPGCTQEACDLRDRHDLVQAAGAVVLGISPDSVKSHEKFAAKYSLPFTLLSDPDHVAAEAYGAWKEKSMYGRSYMGIERSTFLVDEQGKLAAIWPKVKVAGHADAVLAALNG